MALDQKDKHQVEKALREAGLMATTGAQGVGKTYLNMHIIKDYVRDKFYNKVRGRKCLIMDTNGEYTKSQFEKNDIDSVNPKLIAVRDIPAWSMTEGGDCRRIDASSLGFEEKVKIIEFVIKTFKDGMLVLEDINTYILNVTHMTEIVSGLVNLRHRAVDVLVSYQSARAVEPRIWQNARWVRMHYQADNVYDIKNKLPNLDLYTIAQILVNNRYFGGDKRFYVYIFNLANKIEGKFTKDEYRQACRQFLGANKKRIKTFQDTYEIASLDEAKNKLVDQLYEQYYGNNDK